MFKSVKKNKGNYFLMIIRKSDYIRLHNNILSALDNPKNIQFWWSDSTKTLLIGAVEEITPASLPIKKTTYKDGIKFTKQNLLTALNSFLELEEKTLYHIFGEFIPELKMIAFKTENFAIPL